MKQAWHHFLKFGDFGQQVRRAVQWVVTDTSAATLHRKGELVTGVYVQ